MSRPKFKCDLVAALPPLAPYSAPDQQVVEPIAADFAMRERRRDELPDEHGGERGLVESVLHEKGSVSRKLVAPRRQELLGGDDAVEETRASYGDVLDEATAANIRLKAAHDALDPTVRAKYGSLTEVEIRTLLVEDMWLGQVDASVKRELGRVSEAATGRAKQRAEPTATPPPAPGDEVAVLAARVDPHPRQLGATWS